LIVAPTSTTLERPAVPIDPRIRARRIQVQRGVGRRRLQRLVDVGLVLAVAAGFALALRSPLLDVDEVTVRGAAHTSTEAAIEQAGVAPGDQLMDVDLTAVGERVAVLPWVKTVVVHRGLDGRLELELTERTPVAVIGEGPAAVLVDDEGRVLARAEDEPDLAVGLVRVASDAAGLVPGQAAPAGLHDALTLATRLDGVPGLAVQLGEDGALVGVLAESGIEVRFGPATRLDAKVRDLQTVLDQVDLTCADVIDVGSPGNPVLTREEGCS
jgi:cell division protein FtsQ